MAYDVPFGSPLDPLKRKPPLGALGGAQPQVDPLAPLPPSPALAAPLAAPVAPPVLHTPPALPTPPASVQRKRLNPWDKEHISGTLAQIAKGFAGSDNFFGGLSGAAGNVADHQQALMKAEAGETTVGGPDNAFEIHTDADGNRTYKPIAEVATYLGDKRKRENAPKPKETADYIGDMSYAIEQLDPAQRPGAYQLMLEQAKAAGHDVSQAPPEYSPAFSNAMIQRTIGARQGSANAATASRFDRTDADRDASRAITERNVNSTIANRNASNGRANAAAGRAAESHGRRMRAAPPGTRRKGTSDLDYLK